jgi:hypothetical protein
MLLQTTKLFKDHSTNVLWLYKLFLSRDGQIMTYLNTTIFNPPPSVKQQRYRTRNVLTDHYEL